MSLLTFRGIYYSLATHGLNIKTFKTFKNILKTGKCQDIDLTKRKITILKGMPDEISGCLICDNSKLENLAGSPKIVGDLFGCSNNYRLTSLFGVPKYIGGSFRCTINPVLTDVSDIWETELRFYLFLSINYDMAILPILKFNFNRHYIINQQIYEILFRNRGTSKQNIINCQYELITKGFERNARWRP